MTRSGFPSWETAFSFIILFHFGKIVYFCTRNINKNH